VRLTNRGRAIRAALAVTVAGLVLAGLVDSGSTTRRHPRSDASSPAPALSASPVTNVLGHGNGAAVVPGSGSTRTTRTTTRTEHPTGRLQVIDGHGPVVGHGPLRRYRVAVEGGLRVDRHRFTRLIRETLGDRRDWGRDLSFQRVSGSTYAFTVVLASPDTTDQLCAPLVTGGIYSCYNNGRSVINSYRWRKGAASYGWDRHLAQYRKYVIGHEVGHALGHDHEYSCRSDGLAPVMMQQTKSLYGCRRNAWAYP
jgi:hypothetical protein